MRTVEQGGEHLGRERAVSDGVQRCHRSDLGAPNLTTTSYGAGLKRLRERDGCDGRKRAAHPAF
jgi:hypothetical protein